MQNVRSRHLSLAGIPIDLLNRGDLLKVLKHATGVQDKLLILHHNLHSLYLYHTRPDIKAFYSQASWVYVDGLPVVWFGKLAGLPLRGEHRITLLDSFDLILKKAEEYGWRIFYLGSLVEVNVKGLESLRKRYSQLTINGHHGFFAGSGSECEKVITQINEFKADILFVGMGMPIQERWLAEHLPRINASAILTCGATLDYVTGHAYRPPAWVGPLGLYGIFRLFSDPTRLWRRYLIEPIIVFKHLFLPMLQQRLRIAVTPRQSRATTL
jgi:N-acetylglucosaminyldiphosphoundecaprenol N-acetyl-beta-D-mannosaminyltransferase